MNRVVRERLLLPIAIPMGASVMILVLVLIFSRVLLLVPREMAVAVALMVAVNVLLACAVVATRPRLRPPDLLLLLGVAFVPIALGGVVAAGLVRPPEPPGPPPPPPVIVDIAAANIAFDVSEIGLEAGRPTVIRFNNQDTVPHNVAIYTTPEAQEMIFQGPIIQGGSDTQDRFQAPPAGSYFFRCDVHPTQMTGTVVVREAAGEMPQAAPPRVDISAQNLTTAYR
jgi:plastocyanin